VKGGHPPVGLRLLLWAAAVTVVLLLRPTRPAEVVLLIVTLAVHTSAIVALTVTLTGTLRPGELERLLAGRRWPPTLRALLVQILRGVPLLARETAGIARAVALRRGIGGLRTGWRLAAALPAVWLPRVLARAERTTRAAEVRGWTGREVPDR
jgi:energy-coupling factor transporter transmembrane protein EcfT